MALPPLALHLDRDRYQATDFQDAARAERTSSTQGEFRGLVKDLLLTVQHSAAKETSPDDAPTLLGASQRTAPETTLKTGDDAAHSGSAAAQRRGSEPPAPAVTGPMGLMNLKALSLVSRMKDESMQAEHAGQSEQPGQSGQAGAAAGGPIGSGAALTTHADRAVAPAGSHGVRMAVNRDLASPAQAAEADQKIDANVAHSSVVRMPVTAERRAATADELAAAESGFAHAATPPAHASEEQAIHSHVLRQPVRRAYVASASFEALAKEHAGAVQKELKNLGFDQLPPTSQEVMLGSLTARFESGRDGVSAIGYDRMGGTSYGKYQLSSRAGTMDRFLTYLKQEEPQWAERLEAAGPANTRSRRGAMPSEWKAIAAESPERFEILQEKFILKTSYKPALESVKESAGLDVSQLSLAVQEVLHSTAVQHGANGASRIFARAARKAGEMDAPNFEAKLIEAVYDRRKLNFGGSTYSVQMAVKARLNEEKSLALAMLEGSAKKLA